MIHVICGGELKMDFSFCMNTRIYFGNECFGILLSILKEEQYSKMGVLIDHNIIHLPITQTLVAGLEEMTDIVIFEVAVAEPTYRYLEEGRKPFMGSGIEGVIGIGGGSTLDTAKAIAVLVNNKESAVSYRGFDKMTEPVLPVFAVPTTAGTGSEVTPNASFVDDELNKKLGINGEAIRPKYTFLNPAMLESCPKDAAISAGIDALVHAVEAFTAKKASYFSRMYSKEAIGLLINNLESAILKGDKQAMENVFLGSLFAGIAMMNSGSGPAAAFSYPLGVHKKVPHGFAGGVFLPGIMKWNVRNGYYGYSEFSTIICKQNSLTSQKDGAEHVVQRFQNLWNNLKVPVDLRKYGFCEEDIDLFVSDILELKGALEQNPVEIGEREIRKFLEDFI